jgi:pyruvate dehydrogenase E2 component (dihydrolipoamide acetyltransferase)
MGLLSWYSAGYHGSLRRQAILMPAMSPFMKEGTITRWKKKEGETFAPGDILLQIVSHLPSLVRRRVPVPG